MKKTTADYEKYLEEKLELKEQEIVKLRGELEILAIKNEAIRKLEPSVDYERSFKDNTARILGQINDRLKRMEYYAERKRTEERLKELEQRKQATENEIEMVKDNIKAIEDNYYRGSDYLL